VKGGEEGRKEEEERTNAASSSENQSPGVFQEKKRRKLEKKGGEGLMAPIFLNHSIGKKKKKLKGKGRGNGAARRALYVLNRAPKRKGKRGGEVRGRQRKAESSTFTLQTGQGGMEGKKKN